MVIYVITNIITNKKYVGLTTKTGSKFDNYWGSGKIIKSSIKKHGLSKFTKEVLQECSSKDELCQAEKYWIFKLNTIYPNGYNISDGGFDGDSFAGMTKEQLSDIFNKRKINNPDMHKQAKQTRIDNGGYKKTQEQYLECISKNKEITSRPDWRIQIKKRLSSKHPVAKKYIIKNTNTNEIFELTGIISVKEYLKKYNEEMRYTNNKRSNVCKLCEYGETRDFVLISKESAYYVKK